MQQLCKLGLRLFNCQIRELRPEPKRGRETSAISFYSIRGVIVDSQNRKGAQGYRHWMLEYAVPKGAQGCRPLDARICCTFPLSSTVFSRPTHRSPLWPSLHLQICPNSSHCRACGLVELYAGDTALIISELPSSHGSGLRSSILIPERLQLLTLTQLAPVLLRSHHSLKNLCSSLKLLCLFLSPQFLSVCLSSPSEYKHQFRREFNLLTIVFSTFTFRQCFE